MSNKYKWRKPGPPRHYRHFSLLRQANDVEAGIDHGASGSEIGLNFAKPMHQAVTQMLTRRHAADARTA